METRLGDKLDDIEIGDQKLEFYRREQMDCTKCVQIPTYKYLIERWLTLKNEYSKPLLIPHLATKIEMICREINIVTVTFTTICNRIRKIVEEYVDLFVKTKTPKRGAKWQVRSQNFADKLEWGLPVMTEDVQRLDRIKKEMAIEDYNVEEEFYKEFD